MTSPTDGAILVGFLAFLGVILGPIVTGFLNRSQEREIARHGYIDRTVTALIDLRGELQYHQVQGWYGWVDANQREQIEKVYGPPTPEKQQAMEVAFGKAYAIMISVDVKAIRERARDIMNEKANPSEKLAAINFALETLGEEYGLLKKTNE